MKDYSGQCVVVLDANKSTSASPNICHMQLTVWGCSLHFLSSRLSFESMSTPMFRFSGTWTARIDRNLFWVHRRTFLASLHRGWERIPPWWFKYDTTVVFSVLTNTWRPFSSLEKCWRAKKTASSSNLFMCHPRCASVHVPWAGRPWQTGPQPVNDAFLVTVSRRKQAPNRTSFKRNLDDVQVFNVKTHLSVTEIGRCGWKRGEILWLFVHHWNGHMWSKPRRITGDAAGH